MPNKLLNVTAKVSLRAKVGKALGFKRKKGVEIFVESVVSSY